MFALFVNIIILLYFHIQCCICSVSLFSFLCNTSSNSFLICFLKEYFLISGPNDCHFSLCNNIFKSWIFLTSITFMTLNMVHYLKNISVKIKSSYYYYYYHHHHHHHHHQLSKTVLFNV